MSEISENISGASDIDIVKNETVETTEETQLIVETEMVIVEKGSLEIEKEEDEEDDQDSKQKTSMILILLLEFYRVIMGSLLILFVPQMCENEESCSIGDNLSKTSDNELVMGGFVINFLTLLSFITMYYYETTRELRIISYLEMNPSKARDNESVGEALEHLSKKRRDALLKIDKCYCTSGYVALGTFIVNSAVSGIVVFNHMLDGKTGTVFLTNVLFMGSKLGNMYSIISTEKNIFYSAYLTRKVQYNDVDPDKYIEDVKEDVKEDVNEDVKEYIKEDVKEDVTVKDETVKDVKEEV